MYEKNLQIKKGNTDSQSFYRCYGRVKEYVKEGKNDIYHCPICLMPISYQAMKLHATIHGKDFLHLFYKNDNLEKLYFKKFDPSIEKTYKEYLEDVSKIDPIEEYNKLVSRIKESKIITEEVLEKEIDKAFEEETEIILETKDELVIKLNKRLKELNTEESKMLESIELVKGYLKEKENKLSVIIEEKTIINDLIDVYKEADALCQKNISKEC